MSEFILAKVVKITNPVICNLCVKSFVGRKDSVPELQVMISTLHKEMGMMQSQLNKFKEAAHEVHSLRAEIHSLAGILERKVWIIDIWVHDSRNLDLDLSLQKHVDYIQ